MRTMGQTAIALAFASFAPWSAAAQNCPPGRYSASGMVPCTPCAPGTYQPASGQTTCRECLAGRYQSQAGKSYCLSCPVGTYAADTGTSVCTKCAPGTHQPLVGSIECMPCPRGTYQNESGRTMCDRCPDEAYSEEGAAMCRACPPGQTAKGDCTVEVCAGGEVIDLVDVTDIPDDGVDCTHDSCAEDGRPVHAPDPKRCDDGDRCTVDACEAAGCAYAIALACGGGLAPDAGDAGGHDDDAGAGAVGAAGGDASVLGERDAAARNDGGARPSNDALEGGCGCRVGARSRPGHAGATLAALVVVLAPARRWRAYSMMRTPRRARSASTAARSPS